MARNLNLVSSLSKKLLGPKLTGVLRRGASRKICNPHLFLQPLKLAMSNLVYNLGLWYNLTRKKLLGPKLVGMLARRSSTKLGMPKLSVLQPLKPAATSNLLYNLGLGCSLTKTTFIQNWQGSGLGEHQKLETPIYFRLPGPVQCSEGSLEVKGSPGASAKET